MTDKFVYVVLGAGRQGTAAAHDMAKWGDASRVLLVDRDAELAELAAARVNDLLGKVVAEAVHLDATDVQAVAKLLEGVDACLSALPYDLNISIAKVAIETDVHFNDLGGSTNIAIEQHKLNDLAQKKGVSVVPNCGQVPGMGTTLMVHAVELLDKAVDVYTWDGGIPQKPRPPFDYLMTFHIGGLTNEYDQPAVFLRDWKVTEVPQMTELETVEFPEPIGTLEAFVAGGGTDTMPWTYKGKLRTLQNLTLRYPGHFAQLRAFYDLGLWSLEPVRVGDVEVVPRDVFHVLFEPKVTYPEDKDLVIVRVRAYGEKDGKQAESLVEMIDYYDDETGFTAMERGTGYSAAIVTEMMVRGQIEHGAGGVEKMVPARLFVDELNKRGLRVKEEVTFK
ncbi:MAG: saccharopine dehydrogenase family protein [Planctomycetota bacterium]